MCFLASYQRRAALYGLVQPLTGQRIVERFFLSALALLALAGCRGQEEFTYGIHDGFRQGNHLGVKPIPS